MAKAKRKTKISTKVRAAPKPHHLIAQADIPAAQRERFTHEVAAVPNPYGEFIQNGEIKRHKVVRRVPHFETLYRSKVIDRAIFDVLEWYDERLAIAQGGMFKCGLDTSGGGGSAQHHIPTTMLAMEARSDVAWARGFIPADLLPAFDGVMTAGEPFDRIGAAIYPNLCADRAKRKASSAFKIAVNHLYLGVGHRVSSSHSFQQAA